MNVNNFQIPQDVYGEEGLQTANSIYNKLTRANYTVIYNNQTRRIVVLNSSNVPKKIIKEILGDNYPDWAPKISRNDENNIQIKLTQVTKLFSLPRTILIPFPGVHILFVKKDDRFDDRDLNNVN